MLDWLFNGVLDWLAARLQDALTWLLTTLTTSVFTSPDVTVFPQVQLLAARAGVIVNAMFVLAIITAGVIAMGYGTFQIRYQVKDLLPHLVVGLVASTLGTPICQAVIATANALTTSLVGPLATGPRVIAFVRARIINALLDPATALLNVIITLIIVVLLFSVLTSWVIRVAVLVVLAGIAPIALACHGLPQTRSAASLWWRSLLGCLATPLLQAVFLGVGIDLLLDPDHNFPLMLGVPGSDVLNLLLIACLLTVTVRIPRLVARYVTRRGAPMSPAGVVARAVIIQSVTRGPVGRLARRGR